jgi:hypothetical protein
VSTVVNSRAVGLTGRVKHMTSNRRYAALQRPPQLRARAQSGCEALDRHALSGVDPRALTDTGPVRGQQQPCLVRVPSRWRVLTLTPVAVPPS